MFSFFKKRKSGEKKEYITEQNDNGEIITIEKKEWINEYFLPSIEKNKNDGAKITSMISKAIEYGIKDVIEYANREYTINPNLANLENLFKLYKLNNLYDDAIKLYEEQGNLNLTTHMYYDLALLKEQIDKDDKDILKYLNLSFSINNDNETTINKLISYLNENKSEEKAYELLIDLNERSHSWYLSKELAKIHFSKSKNNKAIGCIKKAIDLSGHNEQKMYEIAEILLENKKYVELESYVFSSYNKKIEKLVFKNVLEFNRIVLKYLNISKSYEKALEYLKNMYIENVNLVDLLEMEKNILKCRMLYINPNLEAKIRSCTDLNENNRAKALEKPIYHKQLDIQSKEKKGKKIAIYPFVSDKSVGEYKNAIKGMLKAGSIYLFDILYYYTNIDVRLNLITNSQGAYIHIPMYTDEQIRQVKIKSKSLISYILTAKFTEVREYDFTVDFILYDLEKDENYSILKKECNVSTYLEVLEELVHKLSVLLEADVFDIDKKDMGTIDVYAEYLDFFFDIGRETRYKVFTADNMIKKLLEYPSENTMNIIFSILDITNKFAPEIAIKHKNEISRLVKDKFNNIEFKNRLEKIYEVK